MSAHTPGPWIAVREAALDYRHHQIDTEDGQSCVAVVAGGGPVRAIDVAEEIANAHLIAAAPDLLAACEAVAKSLDHPDGTGWYEATLSHADVAAIRGAIAKARGGK
jgi:hypothetical protein